MAIRREPRPLGSYLFKEGNYTARVRMGAKASDPVIIDYFRYRKAGVTPKFWRLNAENAVEVMVEGGKTAPNLDDGKEIARATLHRLNSGDLALEERPFEADEKPQPIVCVVHPTKMLKATVSKWPTEYEVRIAGYLPNGFAMPVATPSVSTDLEFEWGRLDTFERLLADTEEEAIEAAKEELNRLSKEDLPLKDAEGPDWANRG